MSGACPFCGIAAGTVPAGVVAREDGLCAFLDARPLFPGHVLVVPVEHVPSLDDLDPVLLPRLFTLAQRIARALGPALGAEGTFVAINNRVSQSVPHLHVHVVPRRRKDGLKGFFWPRTGYASDAERDEVAVRIAAALS